MIAIPFENTVPSRILYVSATGSATGSGTKSDPLLSIQAAVNWATPGTTIMVEAGTYHENIKFNVSGTQDAPIQLVSSDGIGAAKIVPTTASASSTIETFGKEDIVISGFDVSGGNIDNNGIQFGMSGTNFTDMTKNIVVRDNIIHDTLNDGIKISQGDYIYVLDNTVSHAARQGIDFVAVNNSLIARNDISYTNGPAALFVKGGSTNDLVAENKIAHAAVDGLEVGGYSNAQWMRPGCTTWEAKNITAVDNVVSDVGKRPLNILGAQYSTITHNFFESNPNYYYVASISADNMGLNSKYITISNDVFDRSAHWLQVLPGQGVGLQLVSNRFDGVWDGGPGGPHSGSLDYNVSYLPQDPTPTSAPMATTISAPMATTLQSRIVDDGIHNSSSDAGTTNNAGAASDTGTASNTGTANYVANAADAGNGSGKSAGLPSVIHWSTWHPAGGKEGGTWVHAANEWHFASAHAAHTAAGDAAGHATVGDGNGSDHQGAADGSGHGSGTRVLAWHDVIGDHHSTLDHIGAGVADARAEAGAIGYHHVLGYTVTGIDHAHLDVMAAGGSH